MLLVGRTEDAQSERRSGGKLKYRCEIAKRHEDPPDAKKFHQQPRVRPQTAKLSKAAVARHLNIRVERLERFESGEQTPTPRQYASLQRIYGVADFVLAGQNRPNLEPLPVDFRKEDQSEVETGPKGLAAFFDRTDHAAAIAFLATELGTERQTELTKPSKLDLLPYHASITAAELSFDPNDSDLINAPAQALRKLRYAVERANLFCFLVQVPPVDYRGLYTQVDEDWGMCLVNKRTFLDKARMFTVAHELAHYILGAEGVSDPLITRNEIERACNRFASQFLAPEEVVTDLWREAVNRYNSFSDRVDYVSRRTLLSKGASAFRLLDGGEISRATYQAWIKQHRVPTDYGAEDTPDDLEDGAGGSGGQWAYNVISDFGYRPIQIIQAAVDRGLIDDIDAGRILNARGNSLDRVFEVVEARVEELDANA